MMQTKQVQKLTPQVVEARRRARAKEKTTKRLAAMDARGPGAIEPGTMYNRDGLAKLGLGPVWFREAVKLGLNCKPAGRVKWVLGKDVIEFIASGKGEALTMPKGN